MRLRPSPQPVHPVAQGDLKIDYASISELAPLGRVARIHTKAQIADIKKSIREFGFAVPLLVDDDGKVLAGTARLEAARSLGMTHVPTVRLSHLSPAQKRAFVIAENRLAERSGWDKATLKAELLELSDIELGFDLTVIGFNEAEIDAIVLGGDDAGEFGDAVPAVEEKAVSRLGDLWEMGEHRLICGDALLGWVLALLMGDERARTVFTDPPYNVPVQGHVTSSTQHGEFGMASGEMSDDEFTSFLAQVWEQIEAWLVPGGLAFMCMDWRHMRHVLDGANDRRLELLNLIVWNKKVGGMGSQYRSQHELIFLLKKLGEAHTNRIMLGKNGRDRSNVWTYEGVGGFGLSKAKAREMHPTVKPLALVRDAILDTTARGDVVLDLFGGSGTTLIAAHDSKRRARLVELDPKYVDVSIRRWQDFSGKQARLAGTGETFAQVQARRAAEGAASVTAMIAGEEA